MITEVVWGSKWKWGKKFGRLCGLVGAVGFSWWIGNYG